MKIRKIIPLKVTVIMMMISMMILPCAFATATITATIGTYNTEVTKDSTFTVPVSVQMSGSNSTSHEVTVTLNPSSSDISCESNVKTISFTADGTKSTSFSVTALNDGTYTNPFSATASAIGLSSSTDSMCDTLNVIESPVWVLSLSGDDTVVCSGDLIQISLGFDVTSAGTIQSLLSVPAGLTLKSGSSSINYGSVTTGSSSWTIEANNDLALTNTITLTMTSNDPISSTSKTIVITKGNCNTEDDTPSSSSADNTGSFSGGVGPFQTGETKIINLTAGLMKTIDFDVSKNFIDEIKIKANKKKNNIKITVKKLSSKPNDILEPKLLMKIYKYIQITHGNLSNEDVSEAHISFGVEKLWFEQNNEDKDNIALLRNDENKKWEEIKTDYYNFDSTYYYFKAKLDGLSYFAIGTKITPPVIEEEQQIIPDESKEDEEKYNDKQGGEENNNEQQHEQTQENQKNKKSSIFSLRAILILLIIIIIGTVAYLKYKKKKEEDKFFKNTQFVF